MTLNQGTGMNENTQALRSSRDLRVYQHGYAVALRIYNLSKTWPRDERYALTDQVRRSSRSVCANLAEAWAQRAYPRHFVSKLSDALGEAEETRTWIDFAHDCGYVSIDEHEAMTGALRNVIGGLTLMMARPAPWCRPAIP